MAAPVRPDLPLELRIDLRGTPEDGLGFETPADRLPGVGAADATAAARGAVGDDTTPLVAAVDGALLFGSGPGARAAVLKPALSSRGRPAIPRAGEPRRASPRRRARRPGRAGPSGW